MKREEWIEPAMVSEWLDDRRSAEWALGQLQAGWFELGDTWAQAGLQVAAAQGGELTAWRRILWWALGAWLRSYAREGQDREPLLDWFCERWPSGPMRALRPVLDYYLWNYTSGPIGLRSLGELLQVAFLPRGVWTPQHMKPVVRTCMRARVHWGRPSSALVTWTDAQSFLRDWVAEARSGGAGLALAAARKLWVRAIEGEDMAIVLEDLGALCASPFANVGFFASCALRVGLRRKADLPPLVPGADKPKPDVRHKRKWYGMNTEVCTARRSQFRRFAQTPARQKPRPGDQPCGVCANPETICIFYENHSGTAWKWHIWEMRCAECGCYTLYWIDD